VPLKKLVLIGGGGHCKACIEVIKLLTSYNIHGILDNNIEVGVSIMGYPVLGNDDMIPNLIQEEVEFLITIGKVDQSTLRKKLFDTIKEQGGVFATIIAPSVYVSDTSFIGSGTILMHDVFINAEVNIGENCIINTRSIIEHEVHVASHTHVSTGVILNGAVKIGEDCLIGSGAVVVQGITIGNQIVVGANATVTKSLNDSGVYIGSPAKYLLK
jgi:sugar O-acyltransferase (sialic acid O-acetyltransferase NeuD family)